jgi:hypothetical protein
MTAGDAVYPHGSDGSGQRIPCRLGLEYADFPLDHRRMVFDRAWSDGRNQVSAPKHSVVGQSSVQHADNHESPNVLCQDNLPRAERPAFDNRLRQKPDGTAALDAVR